MADATHNTLLRNLKVMFAHPNQMDEFNVKVTANRAACMTAFRKLINEVKQSYSRIFIDTKGDLADEALQLAIPKADAAILPVTPDHLCVTEFYRTIEKIVEQNDAIDKPPPKIGSCSTRSLARRIRGRSSP